MKLFDLGDGTLRNNGGLFSTTSVGRVQIANLTVEPRALSASVSGGAEVSPNAASAFVSDFTALLSLYNANGLSAPVFGSNAAIVGQPVFLTYSFAVSATLPVGDFLPLSAEPVLGPFLEDAARRALNTWAAASGIVFLEAPHGQGDIEFGLYRGTGVGGGGFAIQGDYVDGLLTSLSNLSGQVFWEAGWAGDPGVVLQIVEYIFLHEIGHALGLEHPHNGDDPLLDPTLDNRSHTVMSYNGEGTTRILGPLDIAAVQHLYGGPSSDGAHVSSWSWDANTATLTQVGFSGADKLHGVSARDILSGAGGNDLLAGLDGADVLSGDAGDDRLNGGAGDDQLNGGVGGDAIDGGDGFDTVRYDGATSGVIIYVDAPYANTGEAAGDTLTSIEGFVGSTFNDYMVGGIANNVLQGFSGADILEGHGGDDLLDGGDGDDNLQGGLGGDILDGGAGFDSARYDGATSGVTIYVDAAYANVGEAAGDFHISIEGIVGSTFNDYLVGGVANNILQGFSGDDILEGHGGDDLLDGGDGNDQMNGGTGGDIFDGGAGFDTVRYDGATAGVIAFMSDAWANTGEAAGDAYISIEALYGSNFNDTLAGASNANELQGFDGTDFIYGYSGNDFIGGGDGGDYLDGGAGTDQLQGGAGNDQFIFRAGESNGDAVLDFAGNGAAAGDNLLFIGYGTAGQGATFTQLNATQWQITSADGLITDIITLTNGASVDASDYGWGS